MASRLCALPSNYNSTRSITILPLLEFVESRIFNSECRLKLLEFITIIQGNLLLLTMLVQAIVYMTNDSTPVTQ